MSTQLTITAAQGCGYDYFRFIAKLHGLFQETEALCDASFVRGVFRICEPCCACSCVWNEKCRITVNFKTNAMLLEVIHC